MSIEAMKLALEALEWSWGGEPMSSKELEAMQELRKAIEEAEKQEPSAWAVKGFEGVISPSKHYLRGLLNKNDLEFIPLYTHPPKREWVSLTDGQKERMAYIAFRQGYSKSQFMAGVDAADAKLQELNT